MLVHPLCVHFPGPTEKHAFSRLPVFGSRLRTGLYLRVTGEIKDLFSSGGEIGVGIVPSQIRDDFDEEIKAGIIAELAEAREPCEKWQEANSEALREKTHGGKIVLEPQNSAGADGGPSADQYIGNCSIWAVDQELPHKATFVYRNKTKRLARRATAAQAK